MGGNLSSNAARIPSIDEAGNGDSRPTSDLHGRPAEGNYAAILAIHGVSVHLGLA